MREVVKWTVFDDRSKYILKFFELNVLSNKHMDMYLQFVVVFFADSKKVILLRIFEKN